MFLQRCHLSKLNSAELFGLIWQTEIRVADSKRTMGLSLLKQSLLIEQNVDKFSLFVSLSLSFKSSNLQRKKSFWSPTDSIWNTDSFKLAWFTLPDSFQKSPYECQTILDLFFYPCLKEYSLQYTCKYCYYCYIEHTDYQGQKNYIHSNYWR